LILTVLAAVAQFERGLISERIRDAKRNLRRQGKHQGGGRPFGYQFGKTNGTGRARELITDPDEQAALAEIVRPRGEGRSLMYIRDAMRARGFPISHQLVANTIARHAEAGGTVYGHWFPDPADDQAKLAAGERAVLGRGSADARS
jgi:DNA invertase Pin-like site-specific DNA recombinase